MKAVKERLRKALTEAGFPLMDEDPRAFWFKFATVTREGWTGQKLDITTWEDETSFISWAMQVVEVLSISLIFVLLVIMSFGIVITLWIAIRERTREVGTLRAIGMQRQGVMTMFLVESFILASVATVVGAALGLFACGGLNALHVQVPLTVQFFLMSNHLHLLVDAISMSLSIAIIVAVAMIVSLLPSLLAARLKPVTAMHHVG
jgi:ABC-type lipoprotein release transport system permease subunit